MVTQMGQTVRAGAKTAWPRLGRSGLVRAALRGAALALAGAARLDGGVADLPLRLVLFLPQPERFGPFGYPQLAGSTQESRDAEASPSQMAKTFDLRSI